MARWRRPLLCVLCVLLTGSLAWSAAPWGIGARVRILQETSIYALPGTDAETPTGKPNLQATAPAGALGSVLGGPQTDSLGAVWLHIAFDMAKDGWVPQSVLAAAPADTVAPPTPKTLLVTPRSPTQVNLTWSVSKDAVKAWYVRYEVLRDGAVIATTYSVNYQDTSLSPGQQASYQVCALDLAGNRSVPTPAQTVTTPAMLSTFPEVRKGHWVEVPASALREVHYVFPFSAGGSPFRVNTESGGALDTTRQQLLVWGGGHIGYAGNEWYSFDIASLTWRRLNEPAIHVDKPGVTELTGYYPDEHGVVDLQQPRSTHTKDALVYVPEQDSVCSPGLTGVWYTGKNVRNTMCWHVATQQWRQHGDIILSGANTGAPYIERDSATGLLWARYGGLLQAFDFATGQWVARGVKSSTSAYMSVLFDPKRRRLVALGGGAVHAFDVALPGTIPTQVIEPTGDTEIVASQRPGWEYDPVLDRYVAWNGEESRGLSPADVYVMHPDTWVITRVSPAADNGAIPLPVGSGSGGSSNGTYGRWAYLPEHRLFLLANNYLDANVFLYRLDPVAAGVSVPLPPPLPPKATLEIPLTVTETAGMARVHELVSTGVPLPEAKPDAQWSLWDGETPIPAQVTPLQGQHPWLLVDFVASLDGAEARTYTLKDVPAPAQPVMPLALADDPAQATLPVSTLTTYVVDAITGHTHMGTPTTWSWEYRGPVRATMRIDGMYGDFLAYTTRITWAANSMDLRIEHVLHNAGPKVGAVKLTSAVLTVDGGATSLQAQHNGALVWSASSSVRLELVPPTFGKPAVNVVSNGGFPVPQQSYHGVTLVVGAEAHASQPLMALAPPAWYAQHGRLSMSGFATLAQEKAAYTALGWQWPTRYSTPPVHLAVSRLSDPAWRPHWRRFSVHSDLESDDLSQHLIMCLRHDTQTQGRGYCDRAWFWSRYYMYEMGWRTDGAEYSTVVAKDFQPQTPDDTAYIKGVTQGRTNRNASSHVFGWGLMDWFLLTGDMAALDALQDLGELVWSMYVQAVPGQKTMAATGPRGGARAWLLLLALCEVRGDVWCERQQHLATLWLQAPDWDVRGFSHVGASQTNHPGLLGPGAYEAGARLTPAHQAAALGEAMARYHRLTGDPLAAERLILMAEWAYTHGLHAHYQYTGDQIALDWPQPGLTWHSYFDTVPGEVTGFSPGYTIDLINMLVRGLELTGNAAYRERAMAHWARGSKARSGKALLRFASETEAGEFQNQRFVGASQPLYAGNGSLNYSYLLWGQPYAD